MKPSIGRIVHFNIGTEDAPVLAPAIITAVWTDECVNLQVLFDGSNHAADRDAIDDAHGVQHGELADAVGWRTSINLGDGPGEWRWPVRT